METEQLIRYYDGLCPAPAVKEALLDRLRRERRARRRLALEWAGSAAACLALALAINSVAPGTPQAGPGQAASVFGAGSGALIGGGLFLVLAGVFTAHYWNVRQTGRQRR